MTDSSASHAEPATSTATPRGLIAGLAVVLITAVYLAGSPMLFDSPWMLGDEFIFIVNNPDVTGVGRPEAFWQRCAGIFTRAHADLYQPVPILAYALQWAAFDGDATGFRRFDLFLHAANAMLVWSVLTRLLARIATPAGRSSVLVIAWALTLVWALHPTLANAYCGDLGTPHLLTGLFCLLALHAHLSALRKGGGWWFVVAVAALVLANLSKPTPGWLLVAVALEAALVGFRAMLRSPRVYLVATVSLGSAWLALHTSEQSGLIEEASLGLFGDPLSRSLLAVWVYARNVFAPFWLSAWYLPDPHTGWGSGRVWGGLLLVLGSFAHAAWTWRRRADRLVGVGWAWAWGLLIPVLGLVGAREAVAFDRYLYQPLAALLLIAGVWGVGMLERAPAGRRTVRLVAVTAPGAVVGAMFVVWAIAPQYASSSTIRWSRSCVQKAERVVRLNPGDPRALEMLGAAYDFSRNHDVPASDRPALPAETRVDPRQFQFDYYNERFADTLARSASAPKLSHYFPGDADLAQYHRRLSYRLLTAGRPESSLGQAETARLLEPDAHATWLCLARAHRALGRLDAAVAAYAEAEARLPEVPMTRAVHFTEFGELLLQRLERPDLAKPKYEAAIATGLAPRPAWIGLARCEIRVGLGATGRDILLRVLGTNPDDVDALLALGEYHLRSHHWEDAERVYGRVLALSPTNYDALLGFHELCVQRGRWRDAALAWDAALNERPDDRRFLSFFAWSATCAGEPTAARFTERLLERDAGNPLALLARMLERLRGGDLESALAAIDAAARGDDPPNAKSFERAAATLKLMRVRGELPATAAIAEAALRFRRGRAADADGLLREYLESSAESGPDADIARRLLESLAAAQTRRSAPTTAPAP
ncbi:MAG: tetratricopeptide repeat protein [Phycisphaerae bacterium]